MKYLNLRHAIFKLTEYKKISKSQFRLFTDNIDYFTIDYAKYTEYLSKKTNSIFGKRDLKGNFYLQKAWRVK